MRVGRAVSLLTATLVLTPLAGCTLDETGLAEGMDAGDVDAGDPTMDADRVDAGDPTVDAGPGMDAGPGGMDAGPFDAGPGPFDAGVDAGMPDAGFDAGMPDAGFDAGMPDAGRPPCATLISSLPGTVIFCSETPTSCRFYVDLPGDGSNSRCNQICPLADPSWTCATGLNEGSAGNRCDVGGSLGCNTQRNNLVCECNY